MPVAMSGSNPNEYIGQPASVNTPIPYIPSTSSSSGPGPKSGSSKQQQTVLLPPKQDHGSKYHESTIPTQTPQHALAEKGTKALKAAQMSNASHNAPGTLYYSSIPSDISASMFQPKGIRRKIGPRPVTAWTQMYGKNYRGDWQQSEEGFKERLSNRSSTPGQEVHHPDVFDTLFPGIDSEFPRNASQVSGSFYPLWTDSESEGVTPPKSPARLSAVFRSAFPHGVPPNMPAELQQAIMAAAMPTPDTTTFRRASLAERISNASAGAASAPVSSKTSDEEEGDEQSAVSESSKEPRHRRHRVGKVPPPDQNLRWGPLGPIPIPREYFVAPSRALLPPREFADHPVAQPTPEYLFGSPQVTILGSRQRKEDEDTSRQLPEF